jgi:hypothetical protein
LLSQRYVEYAQANGINFSTDVIVLPTGDGAAVGFTFGGLHDVHVNFALDLLSASHESRAREECSKFKSEGWCNCHDYYNLRIGIADGKAVVYVDANGNYNLAGGVVNVAARVMGQMDANQVGMSEQAYEQFVDLSDDPNMSDHFEVFPNVRVKHGIRIGIAQYQDHDRLGLNSEPSKELSMKLEGEAIFDRMRLANIGGMAGALADDPTTEEAITQLKRLELGMAVMQGAMQSIALADSSSLGEAVQKLTQSLSPISLGSASQHGDESKYLGGSTEPGPKLSRTTRRPATKKSSE